MKNYDPTTGYDDLSSVVETMKKLTAVYVPGSCFIATAEIKIENGNGYPVGTITFDSELEFWAFTAHDDNSGTA